MSSIPASRVSIQTSAESVPSMPAWSGEETLIARHLEQQGVLSAVSEKVRFARRRFGHYEVIDFFSVLLGYAVSGEGPLEAFCKRLASDGVQFEIPYCDAPTAGLKIAFLADPEGTRIELTEGLAGK